MCHKGILLLTILCAYGWFAEVQTEPDITYEELQIHIENVKTLNDEARTDYILRSLANFPDVCCMAPSYYMSYTEIVVWLKIAVVVAQIHGVDANWVKIGESYEGRDLLLVEINKDKHHLPAIWIDGGIHANEHISHTTALYILTQMLRNECDVIQCLRNNYRIYILPIYNPDGYEFSLSSSNPEVRLWRKNRQPNANSECLGTDLNRNFATDSENCTRDTDPCSLFYAGPGPASAPETVAVEQALTDRLTPNSQDLYLNLQSYAKVWLYVLPLDSPVLEEVNRVSGIAAAGVTSVNNNTYWSGRVQETVGLCGPGSTAEYLSQQNIIYSYGLELRPGLLPDFTPEVLNLNPIPAKFFKPFILVPSEIIPAGQEAMGGVIAAINAINGVCAGVDSYIAECIHDH